ncbi:hypothetical protein [uncultured Mediterranean phage]|nr:hypothetical protein [uncultured Mediterranean phage]
MATDNMTMSDQGTPISERSAPKTKDETIALVQDTHTYLKGFKRVLEKHWREALLFITGEQWVRFESLTSRFSRHTLEGWVPTPTTDYLTKPYDRIIDILTSPEFKPMARPPTQDQADIDAAQATQRIARHLYAHLQTGDFHLDAAAWLVATGNAVMYANWDAKAGVLHKRAKERMVTKELSQKAAQCPECGTDFPPEAQGQLCPTCKGAVLTSQDSPQVGPDGDQLYDIRVEKERDDQGRPSYKEFRGGEVTEEAVNLFNWYPQPRDDFRRVMYVDEVVPYDIDELINEFGSKAKDVVAEDLEVDQSSGFVSSARSHYYSEGQEKKRAMVRCHYFRHKPCDKFPKGKYIVLAGGTLLYDGDLEPFLDGELPYEHVPYRKIPGEMWGIGPMLSAIPVQKRINAIDSNVILNRKTMLNPQWLLPQGSGVSFIDGRPGLIIKYNPHNTGGFQPSKVNGMGLPGDIHRERSQGQSDLEEIFGTAEVLTGQAPTGVEAGVALNLLQEQAYRRFGPLMKRWKGALSRHEKRKVLIAKKKWKDYRLIRVMGDNNEMEAFHYRGADIGNTVDVVVEVERGILHSESAKKQQTIMAADRGWLGDPRQPNVRAKLLEVLGVEGFETEYVLDAKKAMRLLTKMKDGQEVPPPLPFDIHPIHFQVLSDFTKTSEFDTLPKPVQQTILQRTMAHKQAMQQEAQKAMQAAQAAKGSTESVSNKVAESGAFGNQPEGQTQAVTAS